MSAFVFPLGRFDLVHLEKELADRLGEAVVLDAEEPSKHRAGNRADEADASV